MEPRPYTAVRLNRKKGRDEYDRHFTVDWNSAVEVVDVPNLFERYLPTARTGEVWAVWSTPIGPGWFGYADTHKPAFMLIKDITSEPLMLDLGHSGEIRELSVNKKED